MFKVLREIGPEIVRTLFDIDHSNRNRPFRRPNVRTKKYGEDSISYFGPKVWNEMLPDGLKSPLKLWMNLILGLKSGYQPRIFAVAICVHCILQGLGVFRYMNKP